MRFTKYGRRELIAFGGLSGALMLIVLAWSVAAWWPRVNVALLISLPFILLFVWVLSFFRDPVRVPPRGEDRLVAPADGTVFDIGDFDEPEFVGEECTRVGIFLSIFDCHINRTPCSGQVHKIRYRKGEFHSAWTQATRCSERNESNFVGLANAAGTNVKIGVKQIAGQIARRIVCDLKEGDEVARGQTFGMIKFGSRTELFIPKSANFTLKVQLGDRVRAGRTVIGNLARAAPEPAVPAGEEADAPLERMEPVELGDPKEDVRNED